MPYTVRGRIDGLPGLLRSLEGLQDKLRKKTLKDAIGAASKVVLWEARRRAPRGSGLLRKSLGRKVKVYRNSGVVVGIIGPRTGFKIQVGVRIRGKNAGKPIYANPTQYAHLVELGTRRSAAKPFLKPAFEGSREKCLAEMAAAVNAAIEKAGG